MYHSFLIHLSADGQLGCFYVLAIFFFLFFFKFYFIFKLYNIVLVLPNIEMNPPQVYPCSPSWTLLPPPSPPLPWVVPVYQPQASSTVPTWSSASPVSKALSVFCVNQGISASYSLLLSYCRLQTTRFQSIKGPQQHTITLYLPDLTVLFCSEHSQPLLFIHRR